MKKTIVALASVLTAMLIPHPAAAVPISPAGICVNWRGCPVDGNYGNGGLNSYIWNDDSAGYKVNIGIRTYGSTSNYNFILPAHRYYGHIDDNTRNSPAGSATGDADGIYVGTSYCVRWIQFQKPAVYPGSGEPYHFLIETAHGYVRGPIRLNLPDGADYALSAYPCP